MILLSTIGFGQVKELLLEIQRSDYDLFYSIGRIDSLITNTPGIDTIDASGIKAYNRWKWFWKDRAYYYNNGIKTDYGLNYKAASTLNFSNNQFLSKTWKSLGPEIDPKFYNKLLPTQTADYYTTQSLGLINCVKPGPHFGTSPFPNSSFPNDSTIFAGSSTGGLYHINTGNNWSRFSDDLKEPGVGIMDIAIAMKDTINYDIYIATGKDRYDNPRYGGGIYKNFWTRIDTFNSIDKPLIYKLLTSKDNGIVTLYAAIGDKVYRTNDDGITWYQIFALPYSNGRVIRDMEMKPNDQNTIYIATTGTNNTNSKPELL